MTNLIKSLIKVHITENNIPNNKVKSKSFAIEIEKCSKFL